jgi:hypothetical protein
MAAGNRQRSIDSYDSENIMSEQRNLGMTQRNEELQPIGSDVMSAEDYRGLSAAVDAGFKKFAKRIGLHPSEVGYMPARNPEGFKKWGYYQDDTDPCPPAPKSNKTAGYKMRFSFGKGHKV